MNKIFKEKLSILAEDELMIQAIQTAFNERIENEKPEVKQTDNNNLLGEKYRAYKKAKDILYETITDILNCKIHKSNFKNFNKAK